MKRVLWVFGCCLLCSISVAAQGAAATDRLAQSSSLSNTAAVTNSIVSNLRVTNRGFRLEKTRFAGNLVSDIYGTYYNFKFSLHWLYRDDKLYTHAQADNGDAYNTFSLLGRYSFIESFSERLYPFVIFKTDLYTEYPDGSSSGEAGRVLWGGGVDAKLIKGKVLELFVSTGIDITHDINRELPAMTSWWRSQANLSVKLLKEKLKLSVHGVLSWPFDGSLESWYDVTTSAAVKLSKQVSLIGSLRFYNHQVLEASADGYRHTVSVAVEL